ncbi:hypothetical protein Tco_1271486, partial [Tanacetum coccineum]
LSRRNLLRFQDAREQLILAMESYSVIDQPVSNREEFCLSPKEKKQYLEMVACKPTTKKGEQKKTASKADKTQMSSSAKQSKPAPTKQTKPVKEKTTQPFPTKKIRNGKVAKIHKGKSSLQLIDEDKEASVGGVAIREPTSGVTQTLPVVEGKGKGIATDEQKASTGPLAQHEDDTSANIVRDTPSPSDAKIGAKVEMSDSEGDTEILNVSEEKGEDVSNTVGLEERTVKLDEGKAGSDLNNTLESRPPPDEDHDGSNPRPSHVALAGLNPEPIHEDFIAIVYPKVHESLKHTTEEHVFLENPPSLSGTLSSMKNLDEMLLPLVIILLLTNQLKNNQVKQMWNSKLNPW